jgi:hypothetical protein
LSNNALKAEDANLTGENSTLTTQNSSLTATQTTLHNPVNTASAAIAAIAAAEVKIGESGTTLAAQLDSLSTLLGGSGSTLTAQANGANTALGGAPGATTTDRAGSHSWLATLGRRWGPVNGFMAGGFDSAHTITDQLNNFLAVMDQNPNSPTSTQIQIPYGFGQYNALRSVLAALHHN